LPKPHKQQALNRTIILTADGTKTLTVDEAGTAVYHSRHGALQESLYVFIQQGLEYYYTQTKPDTLQLLEVGFGTGLNALLAHRWHSDKKHPLAYIGLEPHPVGLETALALEYHLVPGLQKEVLEGLHTSLNYAYDSFSANVMADSIFTYHIADNSIDICWFDAFSPQYQPELWTEEVFARIYSFLKPGGILVTYSAKGEVQRALKGAGFHLSKLPGPPGKREMLRATRMA